MTQLTRADVTRLAAEGKHDEIADAREQGRLNVLLGGEAPLEPGAHITDADVKRLYAERRYDEINALRQAGRLDHLMTAPPAPEPAPEPTPPPEPEPVDYRLGYGATFRP